MSQSVKRVLVVDDEVHVIQLVDLALRTEGFEVIAACDGQEALLKAVSEKPDVILLDVNLPDINGFEVCKRLKAGENTRRIPVLFLSAMSQEQKIEQGLSVGAAAYITKPFQMKSLIQKIRQALG
jgi:DNA-binding response OmpR family regulator